MCGCNGGTVVVVERGGGGGCNGGAVVVVERVCAAVMAAQVLQLEKACAAAV